MKIKCVYIDDVNTERSKYKSRFENDDRTKERFAIATYNAPKSLDDYERIAAENPELLMVDYDLSVPDDNGHVIGFQGIALATQLRQQFPEIPIVLFTRKSVFRFHDYDNISKSLSAIDDIIYKQDLFNTNLSNIEKLFQLSVGFKLMRNQRSRGWDDILKLMGASQNDAGLLKLADPPIMHRKSWATVAVATWLKKVIFQYPGILYDSMYAATFLGVSSEAFASEPIQSLFTSSKYSGIFQPAEGLWWKSKLHSVAYSLMNKKEKGLPLRIAFPMAWERARKTTIEKSKCVFSGEAPAEWVCYILHQPVMIKYSLSYKPDSRPSVMEEARVSFEAVRTSNDFDQRLVDPLGQELISEIRKTPKRKTDGE